MQVICLRNGSIVFVLLEDIKPWRRGAEIESRWKFSSLDKWKFCNILSCNAWIIYWHFLCSLFSIFTTFGRLGSRMAGLPIVLYNMHVLVVYCRILLFLTKPGRNKTYSGTSFLTQILEVLAWKRNEKKILRIKLPVQLIWGPSDREVLKTRY